MSTKEKIEWSIAWAMAYIVWLLPMPLTMMIGELLGGL